MQLNASMYFSLTLTRRYSHQILNFLSQSEILKGILRSVAPVNPWRQHFSTFSTFSL